MEVAVLCLAAMLIASGATALIGQRMGDWLLKESNAPVAEQEEGTNGQAQGAAAMQALRGESQGKFVSLEGAESDIEVLLDGRTFLYACLLLLLICFLGMVIPVVGVARLRPAQVLRME
uniref:FtsX-like permease family protein n=1 Tax=Desulfobacca acetoxidans TaxID=60893 RepID=A0A7V4G9N1_9BACT